MTAFTVLMLCASIAAQSKPDLVPSPAMASWPDPITVNPPVTTAGGLVTIPLFAVENRGTANAPLFKIGVYLSTDRTFSELGTRIGGIEATLAAGERTVVGPLHLRVPASVPAGTYHVGVFADEARLISESDETNNTAEIAAPLVVSAPVNVDLRPSMPGLSVGEVRGGVALGTAIDAVPGATLFFSASVENRGTDDSPPFSVGFYISADPTISSTDMRVGGVTVQDLRHSSIATLAIKSVVLPNIVAGSYFFGVLVDEANAVQERAGAGRGNNTIATPIRIMAGPSDLTRIWRVQLVLKTGTVSHAGTDDTVRVRLNDANETIIDYGRDDFESGDVFTYDLRLDNISSFGDIRRVHIYKSDGTDGWCLGGVEVHVNNTVVYGRDFSPCYWIGYGEEHRDADISYSDLRHDSRWLGYTDPPLSSLLNFTLSRADLESMIEANVGHGIAGTAAEWGDYHGRAVEITRLSDNQFSVDLDLKTAGLFFSDLELDVDFTLTASCTCGLITIAVSDVKASVDSAWYEELLSSGLLEVLDRVISGIVKDELSKHMNSLNQSFNLGLSFCPSMVITGEADLQLGLPTSNARLSVNTELGTRRFKPGDTVPLTSVVTNSASVPSLSFSTDVFLVRGSTGTAGVRVGGSNQPGLGMCEATRWLDQIQLPTTLACSAYSSVALSSPSAGPTLDVPSYSRVGPNRVVSTRGGGAYLLTVRLNSSETDANH
jgi:hypothetical protein